MECRREFSVPRQLRICARAGAQGGEIARFQREEVLDGPRGKVLWYEHLRLAAFFLFFLFFQKVATKGDPKRPSGGRIPPIKEAFF